MKLTKRQRATLELLRHGPATTTQLLNSDAGSRFGARLGELRKLGFGIKTEMVTGGAVYRLTRDIERDVERTAGTATVADRSLDAPASTRSGPPADQAPPLVDPAAGGRSAAPPGEPLFELPEPTPRRHGHYDPEEEAA